MKACIVIPARYDSKRFPGKPLAMLAGKSLLSYVCESAQQVSDATVLVATDDTRIFDHAKEIGVEAIMTPESCINGTDRVLTAVSMLDDKPDYIINLQGDSPLTKPGILQSILDELKSNAIVTPAMQLSWELLDTLRMAKQQTPFSGTCVTMDSKNIALWFSKQIIPALRDEDKLRSSNKLSPVYQHIGIYGYTLEALELFSSLAPGIYETLEGLEQLRLLENGHKIKIVKIESGELDAWRGVDTPEDLAFVEKIIMERNT